MSVTDPDSRQKATHGVAVEALDVKNRRTVWRRPLLVDDASNDSFILILSIRLWWRKR